MSVVSAFLVPGSPLPYVQRDNPPWGEIANAMETAGKALAASAPDLIVIYSTQWIAVLDQLWQTRVGLAGPARGRELARIRRPAVRHEDRRRIRRTRVEKDRRGRHQGQGRGL